MDHLKFKQKRHTLQADLSQLKQVCSYLYDKYCPASIYKRRNVEQTQVSDIKILALLCLQIISNTQSQREFFRRAKQFIPHQLELDRTRFNRRAQQLLPVVIAIRQGLTCEFAQTGQIAIIDSLPNPLCQKVRNKRAKIFPGLANIGYNATKNMYFYGFKTHLAVTTNGYILNYDVTSACDNFNRRLPLSFCFGGCGLCWAKAQRKIQKNGLSALDTVPF